MSNDIRKTFIDSVQGINGFDDLVSSLGEIGAFYNEKKKSQVCSTQKIKAFEKRKAFKNWWKDQQSIDYDEMVIAEKAYFAGIEMAIARADGKGE